MTFEGALPPIIPRGSRPIGPRSSDTASAGPSDDGLGAFEPTFSVDPLRRFAPETRSTVFPDPALGGMPQMRIIGRGQYSTCRRGMFLRQIGRFCGRVGTRKALREVFSANASFIIPYVSVALLALLCALGGMKRVAWCFGAGVAYRELAVYRKCALAEVLQGRFNLCIFARTTVK